LAACTYSEKETTLVANRKIILCSDCESRLSGYETDITQGRVSREEALRNAVRDCDTNEYVCFYPIGFSKHGVVFVAEEEVARRRANRAA
jgi:hypothetical protein